MTLAVASWCPVCPPARELWQDLGRNYPFQMEGVGISTSHGRRLVAQHGILSVPAALVDGRVAFVAAPERDEAVGAIHHLAGR